LFWRFLSASICFDFAPHLSTPVFHARALPDRRDDFFPALRFRLPPAVVSWLGFDTPGDDFFFAPFFFALLEPIRERGRLGTSSASWSREVIPRTLALTVAGDLERRPRTSWVAFDKAPAARPNLRAIRFKTGSAPAFGLAFPVAMSFPHKLLSRGKRSPGRQAGTF